MASSVINACCPSLGLCLNFIVKYFANDVVAGKVTQGEYQKHDDRWGDCKEPFFLWLSFF